MADENEPQLMEFCDDNSGDDKDHEIVQVAVEGACRILSNTRKAHAKIETMMETADRYNLSQFKFMFRISRTSFDKLTNNIRVDEVFIQTQTGGKFSYLKRLGY